MLTGVLPSTAGRALVLGRDMVTNPVAAKSAIGVLPGIANPYLEGDRAAAGQLMTPET